MTEAPERQSTMPYFPTVEVQLTALDGNAFNLIGAARVALRRAGVDRDTIQEFSDEATSGNYENLVQTIMRWVQTS